MMWDGNNDILFMLIWVYGSNVIEGLLGMFQLIIVGWGLSRLEGSIFQSLNENFAIYIVQ